jgi:hypothetical protein
MPKYLNIIVFAFLSVWFGSLYAVTTTATTNGNWNNGSTWDNGVPGCGDNVIIDPGVTVTITSNVDLAEPGCTSPTYVEVRGILRFNTGRRLFLACGSVVFIASGGQLQKGNGGGNSNLIEECGSSIWRAGDGNVSGPQFVGSGLPIALKSFQVQAIDNKIHLSWITSAELNNDYFVIQRRSETRLIQEIQKIPGAGNSTQEIYYETMDLDPPRGTVYYRLKQTDFDGGSSHSSWVAVNANRGNSQIRLLTNYANENLVVELIGHYGQQLTFDLFTIEGKHLFSQEKFVDSENYIYNLATSRINSRGTFILRVRSADLVESFKLVLP